MNRELKYILIYAFIILIYFGFIYVPLECNPLDDNMIVVYDIMFYFIRYFPIILIIIYFRKEVWYVIHVIYYYLCFCILLFLRL